MPGIVTRKFRIHNASQFKEMFDEAANDRLYLFIGRVRPWPSEGSPPTPTDSVESTDFDYWRTMLAAKRIQAGDVSYAIDRYDWETGKRYREFNSADTTLYDTPASSNTYYVMTDDYNVYKCLFNNKDAVSTVEPTGTSTSTLVTADGYHWKYMYNITAADALKFQTTSYVPVQTLTANNGSTQWPVQEAAANGTINIIDVTSGGSSYETHVDTLGAVTNTSVMTLASGASATDNIYNGSALYISGGTGSGQQALKILDYVGSTKTVTLANSTNGSTNGGFSPTPDTDSTYILAPLVTVSGDGATTATAFCNVASGAVNYVSMINEGTNYSQAFVTLSANSSHGSAATAEAFIAPPGGHGSDAVKELSAHNIIMNIQLSGSEGDTFPTVNDFREVGILKNPTLSANGGQANSASYDQTRQLSLSSVSGSGKYTVDEVITGGTSGATARVVSFSNTNSGNTAGVLRVSNVGANASFSAETVTGGSSGITATLDSQAAGTLTNYDGELLYIENRSAVSRASDQIEDIKLVVKF